MSLNLIIAKKQQKTTQAQIYADTRSKTHKKSSSQVITQDKLVKLYQNRLIAKYFAAFDDTLID